MTSPKPSSSSHAPEAGQALVELALVLPILLVLVLGIADFARAYNYWNDETRLASMGARYAAVGSWPPLSPAASTDPQCPSGGTVTLAAYVRCQAEDELRTGTSTSNGVQTPGVNVCISVPSPLVGQPATVKVTANYTWLPLPKILSGAYLNFAQTPITGSATMRLETVPPANAYTTTAPCP